MATDDFCYLTTTGRRSGEPHRIEIWYAADDGGDTLYMLAGGGQASDWVRNLLVAPDVTIEVDGATRRARARVLDSGDEAEMARTRVFDKYAPRYDGDLTDWRGRALPVAFDLK